ncbi:aminotransferase class I/II-fold pyridoxal phosphate-dependent enzyme, partial [Burkholderia pseudomallei]
FTRRTAACAGALGLPALREAIAGFYQTAHGVAVAPERIVVTAGASAALLLATAALVDPGDEVLVGDPSYPCNRQFLSGFGADVRLVPTDAGTVIGSATATDASALPEPILNRLTVYEIEPPDASGARRIA